MLVRQWLRRCCTVLKGRREARAIGASFKPRAVYANVLESKVAKRGPHRTRDHPHRIVCVVFSR